MHKILFIIPYFGKWPIWIDLCIPTLKRNGSIDFLFITDCSVDVFDGIQNIKYQQSTFEEYIIRYKKILGSEIQIPNPYKICDLRPFFGKIHHKEIEGYDFYGWTDLDILFGDLRSFYTDDILKKYDVLSTHAHNISGHMALFRNSQKNREMYRKIYKWREALQNPKFVGIDEHGLTNAYLYTFWDKVRYKFGFKIPQPINNFFIKSRKRRMYLVEQYTTPFLPRPWLDGSLNSEQPSVWYYKNGDITNSRDGERKFMYLHLMNFKSSTWRHDGTTAPWAELKNYVNASANDMERGIQIDEKGFNKL